MLKNDTGDSQGWKFYSHGKVVEHKTDMSNDIEVVPIEKQPFQSGAMVSDIVPVKTSGVDAKGVAYSAASGTSKSITATWKGDGTNRVTSPDVRRDDEVMIYTYADTQKYYWTCEDSDLSRRRNEHVQHRFSGTTDESTAALDDSNSYSHTMSPKLGLIDFSTSKANGEVTTHKLQMNSKGGVAFLSDGEGNFIQLEYKGKVILTNSAGTYVIEEGKMMKLHADDTIFIDAKIQTFTSDTSTATAKTSYAVKTATYTLNATTSSTVTTPTYAVKAATSATITSAVITLSAATIKLGTFGTVTAGGASFGGPATNITSQATSITSANISMNGTVALNQAAARSIAALVKPFL